MMKMFTNDQNRALLTAQASLNVKYTGENWAQKVPVAHFVAAMQAEYGELLESSPRTGDTVVEDMPVGWKWWKPYLENDANNNKVEGVDMIHFAMSAMLVRMGSVDAVMAEIEKLSVEDDKPEVSSEFIATALIGATCGFSLNVVFSENTQEIVGGWIYLVDALCDYCEMTPDEMVELYNKKNKLNSERIEGGYTKDADSYQKYDADGNEDNTKMFEPVPDAECSPCED